MGEEEAEGEVYIVVLAAKPRCLAPGKGPDGLWTAEWGAERWAYGEAH